MTDASTQKLVPGASAEIVSSTGTHSAMTNRKGFYAFVDAFANAFVVTVSAPDYATAHMSCGDIGTASPMPIPAEDSGY